MARPELLAGLRHPAARAALVPVPEAPVDEDDLLPLRERDVWPSRKPAVMEPVPIPQRMNQTADPHLGLRVLVADTAHPLAALRR
jgi:hypothetical protein